MSLEQKYRKAVQGTTIAFCIAHWYNKTMNYLLVFLGGGVGAVARYWLQGVVYRFVGSAFPYGTVAVNIIGCFCIGLFMSIFEERFVVNPALRIFLTIGILGGFTTFSSFSFETLALLRDGELMLGVANVAVSVLTCLVATWIGLSVGKLV
jgi:fluoride exporter